MTVYLPILKILDSSLDNEESDLCRTLEQASTYKCNDEICLPHLRQVQNRYIGSMQLGKQCVLERKLFNL